MYAEDDLLPLSGLQHLAYCPRQFALIHLEQLWAENRYTAEGGLLHRRTDAAESETRGSVHLARALRLRSLRLGLAGIADVVEFHRTDQQAPGVELPKLTGRWRPYPVEYKRGRPKSDDCDQVQLCAQALCLEEMLETEIPDGALFYGKTRRRREVQFDGSLRERTESLAFEMHRLWRARQTPAAESSPKCDHCSLLDLCMPATGNQNLRRYLDWIGEDPQEDAESP